MDISMHPPDGHSNEEVKKRKREDNQRVFEKSDLEPEKKKDKKYSDAAPEIFPITNQINVVTNFVGRKKILNAITNHFENQTRPSVTIQIITGSFGMGKSQLLYRYANIHAYSKNMPTTENISYRLIWMFDATDPEAIEQSYFSLANQLNQSFQLNPKIPIDNIETPIETIIQSVHQTLVNCEPWLLCFDNVNDEVFLRPYIPNNPMLHGHCLICSENPNWQLGRLHALDTLEKTPAIELVLGKHNFYDSLSPCNQTAINLLVNVLGGFPMALYQAAIYLRQHKEIEIGELVKTFQSHAENLSRGKKLDHNMIMFIMWGILIEDIYTKQSDNSRLAIALLQHFAFCPKTITYNLIGVLIPFLKENVLKSIPTQKKQIDEQPIQLSKDHKIVENESISLLLSYGLIDRCKFIKEGFSIHKKLQKFIRQKLEVNKFAEVLHQLSMCVACLHKTPVAACDEDQFRIALSPIIESCLLHWQNLLEFAKQPKYAKIVGELYFMVGQNLYTLGEYKDSKDSYLICLKYFSLCRELEDSIILSVKHNLALAYGQLGDYKRKKLLLEEVLDSEIKLYGPDHIEPAKTQLNIANVYGDIGRPAKQIQLFEKVLITFAKYYDKESPEIATLLHGLAMAYGEFGDIKKQKTLLEETLAIDTKLYGRKHINTATTLDCLACVYGVLGDIEKNKKLLEESLLVYIKHYGRHHIATTAILNNLANCYAAMGDTDRAKALLEEVLTVQVRHYGKDHIKTASTLTNLALVYGELGDTTCKLATIEEVLTIQIKFYGRQHVETAQSLYILAGIYGEQGQIRKQIMLLEEVLAIYSNHYGEHHENTVNILNRLAIAYGDQSDIQKQKILLKKVLLISRKIYGKEHLKTSEALYNLAECYGLLNKIEKQKDLLEESLAIELKQVGNNQLNIAMIKCKLSGALNNLGRISNQKVLLEEALATFDKFYGRKHHKTAIILHNLAEYYGVIGNFKLKLSFLEKVLSIYTHLYGKNHRTTIAILPVIAKTYGMLNQLSRKKSILEEALQYHLQVYGKKHIYTAHIYYFLANTHGEVGDINQQKLFVAEALAIYNNLVGPNHRFTQEARKKMEEITASNKLKKDNSSKTSSESIIFLKKISSEYNESRSDSEDDAPLPNL